MDNDSIKNNLFKLRLERNMSQREVAEALGISRNAYRGIEMGKTMLISEKVFMLAEWAGVTPEEIVLGFAPSKDSSRMLKDARERFNTRVKELVDEYENKLGDARKENEFLKERLKEKEDYITTLKSMLAFLQKEKQE
jgi:transcriptional regulator with XRE-family HTH domain